MEARTLAAYSPEIAGAVEASDLRSRERLEELIRSQRGHHRLAMSRHRRRGMATRHRLRAVGAAIHRHSVRDDGAVASRAELLLLGRRGGIPDWRSDPPGQSHAATHPPP